MRRGLWLVVGFIVIGGIAAATVALRTGRTAGAGTEVSVATTAPDETTGDSAKLCVMTVNVRFSDPTDGNNAWPNRRELLVRTVLKYNPDIVGCQEVTPAQGAYLNKELANWYSYYPRAGVGKIQGATPSRAGQLLGQVTETFAGLNTLYYRLSRYELIDGMAGLAVPDEPQGVPSENTFFTLGVLREKAGGGVTIAVDTHIRHQAAFAVKCVQHIREQIGIALKKYPNAAVMMMGDMNHDRTTPVYRALIGADDAADGVGTLTDAFDYSQKRPNELWGNWHAYTGISRQQWPSDLILFNGHFSSEGAALVKDGGERGLWPSDHFFVRTELNAK